MYPLFSDEQIERDAEFWARESYIDELRAEHTDHFLDDELEARYEADMAAEADRDGRDAWADIDY